MLPGDEIGKEKLIIEFQNLKDENRKIRVYLRNRFLFVFRDQDGNILDTGFFEELRDLYLRLFKEGEWDITWSITRGWKDRWDALFREDISKYEIQNDENRGEKRGDESIEL